jgi:RHH-type transcriptional regulator, rel operon repressor / antitoxin RelB
MGESTTMTVCLSKELEGRLERLAAETGRSPSDLAASAIAEYVDAQAWQVEAIREAVEKADAGGPFVSHDDMVAYMRALARGERPEPPPSTLIKPGPSR